MVPIPAEYLPDFWDQVSAECMIEVTCLLPNGVVVLLNVSHNATLAEIKEVSWIYALNNPKGFAKDCPFSQFIYIA